MHIYVTRKPFASHLTALFDTVSYLQNIECIMSQHSGCSRHLFACWLVALLLRLILRSIYLNCLRMHVPHARTCIYAHVQANLLSRACLVKLGPSGKFDTLGMRSHRPCNLPTYLPTYLPMCTKPASKYRRIRGLKMRSH